MRRDTITPHRELTLERYRQHDPEGEFLFGHGGDNEPPGGVKKRQLALF